MAKPIIDVNKPEDSDIIGLGAEAIRETRQEIYNLFPIQPDDLDYNDTSNWWPAGSLTGGFDPDVESGAAEPHSGMQDRWALVGDQVAVWDWDMPEGKNILSIGVDTDNVTITTHDTTNWVNIENDDKVEPKSLNDLQDVFIGNVEPLDNDILVYNDAFSQWTNRPIEDLVTNGADGADGKGWTGTTILQNDAENYVIRFDSAYPELVFDTENLKGPAGVDGASAYQSWLDAGNTGTEQDFLDSFNGSDGADGDSAYQIAVNNGFVGTEQEWLDSLVGAQGDGIHILGHITDSSQLPPSGNVGDAYLDDNGHLWIWENSAWVDAGQVQGPQGEVGPSITLVPGTATKLDHQANPTVTLTDLGNDSYQYDFGIPAGTPAEDVDLEPLENRVSDLETDVGNLQTSVNDVLTDISDIQAEQVVQNAAIQANQDKNNEQDGRLDGLDTSVSDNAAAIEVNANAIADIQNVQGGANTVPDPTKGGDILASNDDLTYGWKTIDLEPIIGLSDTVQSHEVELYGQADPAYKGIKERVEDLETQVEAIGGTDPADHVSQQELSDALYGPGNDAIGTAVDGVYGTTNAITSELESVSQRVGQNETDIEALQTATGNNASDISDLDGRVTVNEGDISAIQAQLTPTTDGYILTGVVTDNGDGTFSKSTTWASNDHDGGVLIDNTEPWDHGQYNTLTAAVIQNDGTAAPRAMLGDLHLNANQKVSVSAAGVCSVFVEAPTKNGVFANLMLDPIAAYTFDVNNFVVPDINEDKWLYIRVVSDGGKWHQVGAHYVGESGGLGSGSDEGVFRSHYKVSQEPEVLTSDRNGFSLGPVQLDHTVTVESGAVWAIF